ncbi:Leucine-responsive regulatory protein [Acinetobacter baumannii]|nr:Leucine-responsive regulatory protein [Acinetobacter baumannii]
MPYGQWGFDFLIKLRSGSMEEFRRIAGQVLWQLPGVKETRSYPVMQVVKDSSKIKIKTKNK